MTTWSWLNTGRYPCLKEATWKKLSVSGSNTNMVREESLTYNIRQEKKQWLCFPKNRTKAISIISVTRSRPQTMSSCLYSEVNIICFSLNTYIHKCTPLHQGRSKSCPRTSKNHPDFINKGNLLSRIVSLRFAVKWVCYLAAYVTLSSSNTLLSFTWSSFRRTLASGSNCKEINKIIFYWYIGFLGFPL